MNYRMLWFRVCSCQWIYFLHFQRVIITGWVIFRKIVVLFSCQALDRRAKLFYRFMAKTTISDLFSPVLNVLEHRAILLIVSSFLFVPEIREVWNAYVITVDFPFASLSPLGHPCLGFPGSSFTLLHLEFLLFCVILRLGLSQHSLQI